MSQPEPPSAGEIVHVNCECGGRPPIPRPVDFGYPWNTQCPLCGRGLAVYETALKGMPSQRQVQSEERGKRQLEYYIERERWLPKRPPHSAESLEVRRKRLSRAAETMRLYGHVAKNPARQQQIAVYEMFKAGNSIKRIALEFIISEQEVRKICVRMARHGGRFARSGRAGGGRENWVFTKEGMIYSRAHHARPIEIDQPTARDVWREYRLEDSYGAA